MGKPKPKLDISRYYFPCPHCNTVINRLSTHLKKCGIFKQSKSTVGKTKDKAKRLAAILLKHFVVEHSEIEKATHLPTARERYDYLMEIVGSWGHVITDGVFSPPEPPPAPSPQQQHQQHLPDSILEDESNSDREILSEECKLELQQAKPPLLSDPNCDTAFRDGSVRHRLREAGMYIRFNSDCVFAIKLKHYLIENTHKSSDRRLEYILRVVGYLFIDARVKPNFREPNGTGLARSYVNDYSALLTILNRSAVIRLLNDLKSCEPEGETVRSYEKAIRVLISFLTTYSRPSDEQRSKLEDIRAYLKEYQAATTQSITARKSERAEDMYENDSDLNLGEIRRILSHPSILPTLSEIGDWLERNPAKAPSYDQYQFVLCCAMAIITIKNAKRPQVAQNLLIREFANRKASCDDTRLVTIGIGVHKTDLHRAVDQFNLDENDLATFETYLECRTRLIAGRADQAALSAPNAPFFVTYSNLNPISQVGRTIAAWASTVDPTYHYIGSNMTRHAVATSAAVHFAPESVEARAISELAAHSLHEASRSYAHPTPNAVVPAYDALNRLESLATQRLNQQQSQPIGSPDLFEPMVMEEETLPPTQPIDVASLPLTEPMTQASQAGLTRAARDVRTKIFDIVDLKYPMEYGTKLPSIADIRKFIEQSSYTIPNPEQMARAAYDHLTLRRKHRRYIRIAEVATQLAHQYPLRVEKFESFFAMAPHIADEYGYKILVSDIEQVMRMFWAGVMAVRGGSPIYSDLNPTYTGDKLIELIGSQQWPGLEIRTNLPNGAGRGVFATMNISAGSVLCDYKGQWISLKEHRSEMTELRVCDPMQAELIETYCFEVAKVKRVVRAHTQGDTSYGHILNHSPKPRHVNARPRYSTIVSETTGETVNCILFTASKDIDGGTQILWNYGERKNFMNQKWFKICPCELCLKVSRG